MEDPYNEQTGLYLQKALNELPLSALDRVKVLSVQDLLKQTQNLAEKRSYYQKKNSDLRQMIVSAGVSSEKIDSYLSAFQGQVQSSMARKNLFVSDDSSWEDLQKMLNDEKTALTRDVGQMQRDYDALVRLHQHQMLVPTVSKEAVIVKGGSEHLAADRSIVLEKTQDQVEDIRKMVEDLRSQVMALQADLSKKDEVVAGLRSQIVDMNLTLAQKDQSLKQLDQDLVSAKHQMDDAQARFDLGQRIIKEKDVQSEAVQKEMAFLKGENDKLRQQATGNILERDQQINELKGIVNFYKERLKVTSEKDKEEMSKLAAQLRDVQGRLEQKEQSVMSVKKDLEMFDARLQGIQAQLSRKDVPLVEDPGVLNMESRVRGVRNYLIHQVEYNDVLSRVRSQEDASDAVVSMEK